MREWLWHALKQTLAALIAAPSAIQQAPNLHRAVSQYVDAEEALQGSEQVGHMMSLLFHQGDQHNFFARKWIEINHIKDCNVVKLVDPSY